MTPGPWREQTLLRKARQWCCGPRLVATSRSVSGTVQEPVIYPTSVAKAHRGQLSSCYLPVARNVFVSFYRLLY